jgi:uncharacterized protein
MKIAILSDAHDQLENTKAAVAQVGKMSAEALLFCGDFCAPAIGVALCDFTGPIYAIFGNIDGDPLNVYQQMTAKKSDVKIFKESTAVFDLGGRKIAMTHYPLYGNALARTGDYDMVCFGHDHQPRIETHGKALGINPGSILGRPVAPSFAIYDAGAHKAVLHALDGSILTI